MASTRRTPLKWYAGRMQRLYIWLLCGLCINCTSRIANSIGARTPTLSCLLHVPSAAHTGIFSTTAALTPR